MRLLNYILKISILIFGAVCVLMPGLYAQETASHQVTINVPNINEISSTLDSFTLSFGDYIAGSQTNTQEVTYTIRSNNLERNTGIVQAHVSTNLEGITLQADVGAFSKKGGNASLVEAGSGYIPLGNGWVNLCNRQIDSGTGKIASGTLPVTYKAVALEDLARQDVTVQVDVVLVDV